MPPLAALAKRTSASAATRGPPSGRRPAAGRAAPDRRRNRRRRPGRGASLTADAAECPAERSPWTRPPPRSCVSGLMLGRSPVRLRPADPARGAADPVGAPHRDYALRCSRRPAPSSSPTARMLADPARPARSRRRRRRARPVKRAPFLAAALVTDDQVTIQLGPSRACSGRPMLACSANRRDGGLEVPLGCAWQGADHLARRPRRPA